MTKQLGMIPGTNVKGRERSTGNRGKMNKGGRVILPVGIQRGHFEKKRFYLIHVHKNKPLVFLRFFEDPSEASYTNEQPLSLHRFKETTAYAELKSALASVGLQPMKGEVKLEWNDSLEALEIDLTNCIERLVEKKRPSKRSKATKKEA